MNRRLTALAVVMVLTLSGCATLATEADMSTQDAAAVQQPRDLGPTPADEQVTFTVSLRLPGAADLDAYLAGLTQPGSDSYRKYLRPAEFGARFGLPAERIGEIVGWLESAGLSAQAMPQRTSVAVSGSAAQVTGLLGIGLADRATAEGLRYHVPIGEPAVPAALRDDVAAIVGLDTEPVLKPAFTPTGLVAAGVPANGLVPDVVRRAYEIEPLHAAGFRGEGMSVAIVSFDTFTPGDVTLFDERIGLTGAPDVELVRLPGAAQVPGDGTGEVALDIQVIRGIAPMARIINYEGPNNAQGFVPIIARIVADDAVDIVSISWGTCENLANPFSIGANEAEFAAAMAAGISIFVASGDDGAFDCRRVQVSDDLFERDLSIGVDYPGSSPSVVGVGGTFLSVRQDGSYLDEAGWEEPLGGGGGGGGLSRFFDRPGWQVGSGVDNAFSNGQRQVPDVAGPADPSSGFFVVYTEPGQGLVSGQVGGTSAAAPFWAASMLLTLQLAQSEGLDTLGPLGPTLYQVAAQQPDVFHDVVRGGNLHYQAGPGWDYSTGLGSPRVAPLARAIVDFLSQ